jgi:hypothetical protein
MGGMPVIEDINPGRPNFGVEWADAVMREQEALRGRDWQRDLNRWVS